MAKETKKDTKKETKKVDKKTTKKSTPKETKSKEIGKKWQNNTTPLDLFEDQKGNRGNLPKSMRRRTYEILDKKDNLIQIKNGLFDTKENKVWVEFDKGKLV